MLSPLEKSLILSYLNVKQAISNLEVVTHELHVKDAPDAGRMLHRFNNLLAASRKAFAAIEKNINYPEELLADLEKTLEAHWDLLDTP